MKLKQYQQEAKRTCASLGDLRLDLSHMVMGICSEEEEYIKAIVQYDRVNILEEVSDKVWYIANYCSFRGFDLDELYKERVDFNQEQWEEGCEIGRVKLSKLQDYVKKFVAYGKPLNEEKEKDAIKGILFEIDNELSEFNLDLEKGLERNIAKLRQRFPEKFNADLAINRDVEKERQILETGKVDTDGC